MSIKSDKLLFGQSYYVLVSRPFGGEMTVNLSLYFFVGFVNTVTGSVKVVVTSSTLDKENRDHYNILKEICKP